ncbi:helix-turn-helix domain-containing protein [Nocardioides sp. AE5]|uniref:helix-turn-helix domain-containing protein n=1 Tax=Nocardioides sp. AE5 TaxID=2962573 RepID=UPI002881D97E|nr:helix-turn-helix domain-containing protein [Nocardioides sp. AE5]MDT0201348.1 helix-turn-helix domain-containing protein [Nocardioides sp. AE5]
MLIGVNGPGVVLDARTCAWLEGHAGLTSLRVRVRGTDPEISRQLVEIRAAAMAWRGSATGTEDDTKPEPVTDSGQWLSTGQAAQLAGVTGRAIRKAINEQRLPATEAGGRYRISREDIEHFKAARTAR